MTGNKKDDTIQIEREATTIENKIIETYTDKNKNKWEIRIMTNIFFGGEKYKVLYKNGKKVKILERIEKND